MRYAFFESALENFSQQQINSIIFSDEKVFKSDIQSRAKVYRPPNSRYEAKFLSYDRLSGRIAAAYWGAIGIEGPVTPLVRIDGKFTARKYLNILKHHVVPTMNIFDNNRIFMQDNSPIHTAGIVTDYLSRQKFEVMPWCPYSPDANPIENVWSYMIRDWPKMKNRSQNALDHIVQERWAQLRHKPEYFRHLYESYLNRCREILQNEGNWCSY